MPLEVSQRDLQKVKMCSPSDQINPEKHLFPRFKGLKKGYVQVYTGDGKGKSTAAFGLALRAMGNGARVFIGQFLKNGDYGEIKALRLFGKSVVVRQFGTGHFLKEQMLPEDERACRQGVTTIKTVMISGDYDLVILDEINIVLCCGLLTIKEMLGVIEKKANHTEVVITGRYAVPELLAAADLVTEMKEIKHYYHNGVMARTGIEK